MALRLYTVIADGSFIPEVPGEIVEVQMDWSIASGGTCYVSIVDGNAPVTFQGDTGGYVGNLIAYALRDGVSPGSIRIPVSQPALKGARIFTVLPANSGVVRILIRS